MMDWLRKVLGPQRHSVQLQVAHPMPSPELTAAKIRHKQLLSRADVAIKEAMAHADEMFEPEPSQPAYRGPDRRHR